MMKPLKLEIGLLMRRNNETGGFTLIEVMMVVLIFSIMLSFILINSNFTISDKTKLKNSATNLYAKIKLAKQEAVFQHCTFKLEVNENSLNFMRLTNSNNQNEWKTISQNSLLSSEKIDRHIQIVQNKPLILYPNGSFSEFNIHLRLKNSNDVGDYVISSTDGTNIRFIQNANP